MKIIVFYRRFVSPQILKYIASTSADACMISLEVDHEQKHFKAPIDLVIIDTSYSIGIETDVLLIERVHALLPDTPVLLVTNQMEKFSYREKMLDRGVDMCVQVPFLDAELEIRLKKLIARRGRPLFLGTVVKTGNISVDLRKHDVNRKGEHIKLTKIEYGLLFHLSMQRNKIVSNKELGVYLHKTQNNLLAINVHMLNLRRKLKDTHLIKTVPRYGFVMSDSVQVNIG